MKVHPIFPTAVARFELNRQFSEEEFSFLLNQEYRPNASNSTSINNYVLNSDILSEIKIFIDNCLTQYLELIIAPCNPVKLKVTQSWINYTKPGQSHHKHNHPNSLLSGVFYIKSNKETDRIYFNKTEYQQLLLHTLNHNLYNSTLWWFESIPGELLIFPSSLTHYVEAVQGSDTRISLSFNTFPVGQVGEEMSLASVYMPDTLK